MAGLRAFPTRAGRAIVPALALAALALLGRPWAAEAQTPAGNVAADRALAMAAAHTLVHGERGDVFMVESAWEPALIAPSVFATALAGATSQGEAATRVFAALCARGQTGIGATPGDQPDRGDLVRYAPQAGEPGYRLGIVTDQTHVAVLDLWTPRADGDHEVTRVERDQVLLGGWNRGPDDPAVSRDPAAVFCHVRHDLLGAAGVERPALPGRIELIDGHLAAEQVAWAVQHPVRTADPLRSLGTMLGIGIAILTGLAGWALGHLVDLIPLATGLADAAVRRLGWWSLLSPVLLTVAVGLHALDGVRRLLGASFDGRGAHRVLTGVLAAGLGLILWPLLSPLLAAVALGRLTGRWSTPGAVATLMAVAWNILGLTVTTVTGVNDGPTRGAEVVLALAGDLALVARPGLLVRAAGFTGSRLGGPAAGRAWAAWMERAVTHPLVGRSLDRGHGALGLAQDGGSLVSDVFGVRPTVVLDLPARSSELGDRAGLLAAVSRGGAGHAAAAPSLGAASTLRVASGGILDVASWLTYRPSSALSDLVSECGRLAGFLEHGLATVDAESHAIVRAADRLLAHLPAEERRRFVEVVLPRVAVSAALHGRHTGAAFIGQLAAGQQPQPPFAGLLPHPSAPVPAPPPLPPAQPLPATPLP